MYMTDEPYLKREIDRMFQSIEEKLDDMKEQMSRIEDQTTKHNHRMTKLERVFLILSTAVGIMLIIRFPELSALVKLVL